MISVVWIHLVATLFMTGLIWFVQIVHYPLFGAVDPSSFPAYHAGHTRRTGWVVVPPMGIEAATAVLLVVRRPQDVPPAPVWIGLALVIVIWVSTGLAQVPRHRVLARGYSDVAVTGLVLTNWVRTAAWSLRTLIALQIARVAGF